MTVSVVVVGPNVLVVEGLVVVVVGAVVVVLTGVMVVEVDVVPDPAPSPHAASTNVTPAKRTRKRRLNFGFLSFKCGTHHIDERKGLDAWIPARTQVSPVRGRR
jgi:hypothetical protein